MKLYLSGKINRGCNRIPIIPFNTTIQLVTASVLKSPTKLQFLEEAKWPKKERK